MTAEDKIKLKAKEKKSMDKIEQTFAEIRKHNAEQDASMQEIAAQQHITNAAMLIMKEKIDTLSKDIKNGLAERIMTESYKRMENLTQTLIKSVTTIVQNQNTSNTSIWKSIFSKGGFAVAIITGILALGTLIIKSLL